MLCLELDRSRMRQRMLKMASEGKLSDDDKAAFERAWEGNVADLHVLSDPKLNERLDTLKLDAKRERAALDESRGAIYLDLEGRFNRRWASRYIAPELFDKLLVVRNDTIEQATDAYAEALRSGAVAVAVLDSVGGAPPDRVFTKFAQSGNVGGNALCMTLLS